MTDSITAFTGNGRPPPDPNFSNTPTTTTTLVNSQSLKSNQQELPKLANTAPRTHHNKDTTMMTTVDERRLDFRVRFQVSKPTMTSQSTQTPTVNVAKIHKTFIRRFMEAAGDVTFIPSNTTTDPPMKSFADLSDYPDNGAKHKRFF